MYHVPKEHTTAKVKAEVHRRVAQAEGSVTDPAAAQSLLNIASASQIRDVTAGAPAGRGRGAGAGRGGRRGGVIKGAGKDAGAPVVAKKVNLATEANQLKGKITKFHLNILELEKSKSTAYDTAVLTDAKTEKTTADDLLADYHAMQLRPEAGEPEKVTLQTRKNAFITGTFKDAEKILVQRIAAKKQVVPATPPAIT